MTRELLAGTLVRLAAQDPHTAVETIANWNRDTEYVRLLAVDPVKPANRKKISEMLERSIEPEFYSFGIRTLPDDKLIGFIILMHVNHVHGEAFVGIGIGDSEYRSRGYGSDAMRVLLRFAFQELNLHRVSLDAVAANSRAVRSYEKVGFVHEGRTRGTEYRNRVHDDLIAMGILKREWEALYANEPLNG
jgi:RimJ/RimL family protein N-acetyltransferase